MTPYLEIVINTKDATTVKKIETTIWKTLTVKPVLPFSYEFTVFKLQKVPLNHFKELRTNNLSLNTSQVPYLPIFADKLSSLGFSNFGLFLVNEKGTCKWYI